MVSAISTLIGEELERSGKCSGTFAAPNGSIYGIPCFSVARRVVKFNPIDKSITFIGPDLRDHVDVIQWSKGAMTNSGVIYCPHYWHFGILKIDTSDDTVTVLDVNLLSNRGNEIWTSCAVALDGCVYFMPDLARRIMKLDPNNGDAISSVGDDLDVRNGNNKYKGTVVGIDGCVYGIPYTSKRIVKYNTINGSTSFVGEEAHTVIGCNGDGALGRDGCIYAVDKFGRVDLLKIDTKNNLHCLVGNTVEWNYHGTGWGDGILGIDGCIYWPPTSAKHILKYDPNSNITSMVGDYLGNGTFKWRGACTAPDGITYCLPDGASRVLAIDPLKEYALSLKSKMEEHPDQLGCLFHTSDDMPNDTNIDRAVTKFGQKKVLELLDECMSPVDHVCTVSILYPFMIAASLKNGCVFVIYHLLRQMPFVMNELHQSFQ